MREMSVVQDALIKNATEHEMAGAAIRAHAKIALQVVDVVARSAFSAATISVDPPSLSKLWGVLVRIDLDQEQSFKAVAPLIEALEEIGLTTKSTDDWAEMMRRTFCLRAPSDKPFPNGWGGTYSEVYVNVMVFAKEGGGCQKVEVGMEPKYELRCEDAA